MKKVIILTIVYLLLFTFCINLNAQKVKKETVTKITLTAKVDDYSSKSYDEVKKIGTYDDKKKEVTFEANKSSNKLTWRLVYNDTTGVLFESDGTTTTIMNLFEGTKEECLKETENKKIKIVEDKLEVKE